MSTTITIKLNQAASQFAAGESTGFGIRGGVRYYDRDTKTHEYTNYEAVIFAKAPGQIQFYQQSLVEGAVIEVVGKQEKIKTFDGQNGQKLSIELLDASLGMIHAPQNQPQNNQSQGGYSPQQSAPQSQGYAPQGQPQQQQYNQAPQQSGYNQPQNAPHQQGGFNPSEQQNTTPL